MDGEPGACGTLRCASHLDSCFVKLSVKAEELSAAAAAAVATLIDLGLSVTCVCSSL